MTAPDADREVPPHDDDDAMIVPDDTSDSWSDHRGDEVRAEEERLLAERPPHH